jgi:hypothetical protein
VQVDSSTLSGNLGGGIFADPHTQLVVANSTLSGNGVAVTNYDSIFTISISNSTLNESSTSGADISNEAGVITIDNTVLKVGPSGHSIVNIGGGHVTSLGYNLSSDDGGGYLNGPGDQINTDPILGPLQDNGGPTFTHALLPGSPALNAGDPNFTPPPFFDQRGSGFDRVRNGRLDVGSYEEQALLNTPTPTSTPTATPTLTATVTPTATVPPSPTATPSACTVNITDPDCDSVINTQPVDFFVQLSDPTDPSSVQPTDFMVNGTPADSYMIFYLTQIVFHFNTSPAVQGLNVMHIPVGAFICSIGGTPEFTCTFTYQPSTPTPTPTSTPAPRSTPIPRPRPTPAPRP